MDNVVDHSDPWIVDLRKSKLTNISRLGLSSHQNYRMSKYRRFTIQIVLGFFLLSGIVMFAYMQYYGDRYKLFNHAIYETNFEEQMFVQSKPRKGLLIVTNHRSGSTFLGQFFNQRLDSFYVFEPLITLQSPCNGDDLDESIKVKLLRDLLYCNIKDQAIIFNETGKPVNSESIIGSGQRCFSNNFCFREKIRALCTEEFCSDGNPITCRGCGPVNATAASLKCHSSNIVVIKLIRLCRIASLKPLFLDQHLDLKIVHLLRDPRGILNSRSARISAGPDLSVENTCKKMYYNIEYAAKGNEAWLKGRYKVIRYEDLCQDPLIIGLQLYQFSGLSMTSRMMSWISDNTKGRLSNLGDVRGYAMFSKIQKAKFKVTQSRESLLKMSPRQRWIDLNHKDIKEMLLNDPYTTTRNSSATWSKWTTVLDIRQVKSTQAACKDIMSYMGYRMVNDRQQLNNSVFQILEKFCPDSEVTFC